MSDQLPPQAPPPIQPPAQPPYGQQPPYPQQPGQPGPYGQPGYAPPPPTEGLAIAGLITGILFWPVGIFLNPMALGKIRRTGAGGRGMAITGLVFSIVGAVFTVLGIIAFIITAVFAAGTIATVAGVASQYDSEDFSSDSPFDDLGDEPVVVAQGERGETSDGVGIVVSGMECDILSVGPADFALAPLEGQFCRVDLTIDNAGDSNYYFSPYDMQGYVGETPYIATGLASVYDPATESLDTDLAPGASIVHPVYFDLPLGTRLTSVELTNILGAGVEVTLQ